MEALSALKKCVVWTPFGLWKPFVVWKPVVVCNLCVVWKTFAA
jgi:hypothetical protein